MKRLIRAYLLALSGSLSCLTGAEEFRVADPASPPVTPFSTAAPGATLPAPWKFVALPKIKNHTRYTLIGDDDGVVLRADAKASMASITHPLKLDPQRYPVIAWRWKIGNLLRKADMTAKTGDDFPARVYVLFDYDSARLSFAQRSKMHIARMLHGIDVPAAALCYVWDGRAAAGTSAWSPYTDRVRMIVVESGAQYLNRWREARRNVVADFRAAFGENPPPISGVAIVSDTDNTGESATAWFGDIRFLEAARTPDENKQ